MNDIVPLQRAAATPTVLNAKERLWGVFQLEQLASDEIEFFHIFDTANECIRIVPSDFGKGPEIDKLVGHLRERKMLNALVRDRVVNPPATSVRRPGETRFVNQPLLRDIEAQRTRCLEICNEETLP